MKSTWFTAIHELIRKNKRFATIRLTATDRFCQWERTDILQHRL